MYSERGNSAIPFVWLWLWFLWGIKSICNRCSGITLLFAVETWMSTKAFESWCESPSNTKISLTSVLWKYSIWISIKYQALKPEPAEISTHLLLNFSQKSSAQDWETELQRGIHSTGLKNSLFKTGWECLKIRFWNLIQYGIFRVSVLRFPPSSPPSCRELKGKVWD